MIAVAVQHRSFNTCLLLSLLVPLHSRNGNAEHTTRPLLLGVVVFVACCQCKRIVFLLLWFVGERRLFTVTAKPPVSCQNKKSDHLKNEAIT